MDDVWLPVRFKCELIWTNRCFKGIDFSYFVYIFVIITCRILHFQYGDSFLVMACRMRILRRMLANQIHRYKQIALKSGISTHNLDKNHNFIFTDNVHIVSLFCNVKTTVKLSEKSRTSVILIIFNGVLYQVHAYTVTISYRCSTWIRYQKSFIRSMTK